jgi:hypothetical protein
MALFGVLALLGILGLVLGIVYTVVTTNIQIGGNSKRQQESFAQADAGIQYIQARVNADLQAGTLTLGAAAVPVNFSAPTGFHFDTVTNLTRLANRNRYLINVTGRSGTASTTIQAVLGRRNALGDMGIFGDRALLLQPGFDIYSYDSTVLRDPMPFDSTSEAGAGSNESVSVQPGASVDGVVYLGASASGIPAVYSGTTAIPTVGIDRVTPDPLGAVGGALAASITHYSNPICNDNAAAGIVGNQIDLPGHGSFTVSAGYYFLTSFTLGSHAELTIDSTPGNPAVVFLTGEFRTQPSSRIVSTSGSPQAFYIFSSSSGEFRIQPNSEFRGFVYAPYADLLIQPNSNLYGVFWGGNIRLQPGGDLFIDSAALNDFVSGSLELVQWKEIR